MATKDKTPNSKEVSSGNKKYTYFCPIRGEFDSRQLEQEYVIECLNWLIKEKRVPKEYIKIDKPLYKFGSGGKNSIRPDIIVFNCPAKDAKDKSGYLLEKVSLIVEVKTYPKEKDKAIENQIHPILDNKRCKNLVGGVYWDSTLRIYIDRNKKEYSIHYLSDDFMYGKSGDVVIRQESLMPLKRGEKIWDTLAEVLRTNQGASRGQSYEDLFKVLVSKYFDEAMNDIPKFGTFDESATKVFKRINDLYKDANKRYKLQESFSVSGLSIGLNKDTLYRCVKVIEPYALGKTDRSIIQEFYMKFAPAFLQEDLKQYYTPKEIVSFMTENIVLKKSTQAIDPCCGTGDFMVGVLRKAHQNKIGNDVGKSLFCWDINPTATKLAKMNMILNGDGRTNIETINSLDEYEKDNQRYDYVITNPPFGRDSIYENGALSEYNLGDLGINETGKIFFERSLNLLDDGGVLISVAPSGFLNNPRDRNFRKFLFKESRMVGCILLPTGTFKRAGTDVDTAIIILQKTSSPPRNYRIFMAVAENVGFDVTRKNTPILIKRREKDGVYLRDQNNNPVVDNDLVRISEQLKTFALDEKLTVFEPPDSKESYDYVDLRDISDHNNLTINPRLYDKKLGYSSIVGKIGKQNFFNPSKQFNVFVSNSDGLRFEDSKRYKYIETGDVYKGNLKEIADLRGWQLPGRARQRVKKDDILVAKMGGSEKNFLYVFPEWSGYLASNGFYKVQISDERMRLSFYHFLFSDEYLTQSKALPTGSIMKDVKIEDFETRLYVPLLDDKKFAYIKEYLKYQHKFIRIN